MIHYTTIRNLNIEQIKQSEQTYFHRPIYSYIELYINRKYNVNIKLDAEHLYTIEKKLDYVKNEKNKLFFVMKYKKDNVINKIKNNTENLNDLTDWRLWKTPVAELWHYIPNNILLCFINKKDATDEGLTKIYSIFNTYITILLKELGIEYHADDEMLNLAKEFDSFDGCVGWLERTFKIKELDTVEAIKKLFTRKKKESIEEIETKIKASTEHISDLLKRYAEALESKEALNKELTSLIYSDDNEACEKLMRAINATKNASITVENNESILIEIKTFLTNVDADKIKEVIKNEKSYIYTTKPGKNEEIIAIMKELYLKEEPRYKLKVFAEFTLYLSNYVKAKITKRKYLTDNTGNGVYTANPHLCNHACMGSNGMTVEKLATAQQFEDLVFVLIGITANWNAEEYVTSRELIYELMTNEPRCIYDTETGETLTPNELYERIKND